MERVWLTFQSGLHVFKSRAVHQPRSTQLSNRGFGSFRILLSTVLKGFVEPRQASERDGKSAEPLSFIYNEYSFIMNHPSMLTYIYILYYDGFLRFCSILFRIRSGWTNRNEWGTRLPRSRKANSLVLSRLTEKQKARNSQTFALKSLSLQIQSLRTRFWKIHCGILWKRIVWTFVEVEFLVRISSREKEKSYTCLLEFHRWYLYSWYSDIHEKKLQWLWLDILDMQFTSSLVAKEQTFPVACSFCSRYEGGTPRVAIGLEA